MQSDKIIKTYKEAFEQLENYDKTRELDIGRKRIDITLDKKLIKKLKQLAESEHKAISRIIEDALTTYLRKTAP
ncbi:MAG: ribbon-helix-helix protein, CopG family [Nanoarchaeota archaeon]|nr:ribbon-helix-helix protein, CopG family [Nanoarchaeota archaeon]